MREAVDAVCSQGMSVAKAAQLYGMPLSDHVHGTILPGAPTGAPTLLSI